MYLIAISGEEWQLPCYFILSQFTVSECLADLQLVDDVRFLNQIEEVESNSLRVLYSCSEPSVIHVEAVISFDSGDTSTVFRRHWTCYPGSSKVRTVALTLPDWLVYQADWKVQPSAWVLSAMLRGWVSGAGSVGDYMSAPARTVMLLNLKDPFSRPLKQHQLCLSWGMEMMWGMLKDKIPQCPKEQGTDSILHIVNTHSTELRLYDLNWYLIN